MLCAFATPIDALVRRASGVVLHSGPADLAGDRRSTFFADFAWATSRLSVAFMAAVSARVRHHRAVPLAINSTLGLWLTLVCEVLVLIQGDKLAREFVVQHGYCESLNVLRSHRLTGLWRKVADRDSRTSKYSTLRKPQT